MANIGNLLRLEAEVSRLYQPVNLGQISRKAAIKPPTFDGKTSCLTYLTQLEAAAKANGWTNPEKATVLIVTLRGDASDVFQTIPRQEHTDYSRFIKRMEMRYGQAHLDQVYHAQLRHRLQKMAENLQKFETAIARLIRLATQ